MSIDTERLQIRPWQLADLYAMAAWPPFTDPLDQDWNWPQEWQAQGLLELLFAIRAADLRRREWTVLTKQGDVIGYIGLRELDETEQTGRLSIGFGCPYVGLGYGYEALSAFLRYAFDTLQLRSVRLDVGLSNVRARRLYDRLGFRETGTFWRELGPAAAWRCLDQPRYDDVRHSFRWSTHNVYMLCAEMELEARDWRLRLEAGNTSLASSL